MDPNSGGDALSTLDVDSLNWENSEEEEDTFEEPFTACDLYEQIFEVTCCFVFFCVTQELFLPNLMTSADLTPSTSQYATGHSGSEVAVRVCTATYSQYMIWPDIYH